MSQPHQTQMATISLETFHNLLSDAYAVTVNSTLYFVGYDTDDSPYISDNDRGDYVDLSSVDGVIQLDATGVFFYIGEEPIRMNFLMMKTFNHADICHLKE
jgi:hypothetical protein